MQSSDEKDQRIKEIENENRKLQEKVQSLEHNVEILTQAVLHASKQRFGASTEKTPQIYGQCFLFGELIDEISDESEIKVINIKEHKRPVREKGDREKLIKALPHEIVECILNDEEAVYKVCGSELEIIGKKKVRSEIEYIPAKLIIKDYVQYVYKCVKCVKNDTNPYDSIYCAPVPAPVLTHSFASPSSVAWIMYQKYMMSIPLYRQGKDFKRMGAGFKRVAMATWQVNHGNGKKASSKSFIWIHRSGNYEGPPIILYKYTSTRSGEHAKKFLEGFQGYHVSDAYAGYEKVEGITRCLCFSHLRRYYIEAIPLDSRKKEIPGLGGAIGRAYCGKLFKLERKWKELTPEERKKNRLIKSVPVLDAFFTWTENTFTNQENLKKALGYILNHKKYFT